MMFILPQVRELQRADITDIVGTGSNVLPSGIYRNITGNFSDLGNENTVIYCLNFNANITGVGTSQNSSYTATVNVGGTMQTLFNSRTSETSFILSSGNQGGTSGGGGGGGGGGGAGGGAGGSAGNGIETPSGFPGAKGVDGNSGKYKPTENDYSGGTGGTGGNGGNGGVGQTGFPTWALPLFLRFYPPGGDGGRGGGVEGNPQNPNGESGKNGADGGTDAGGNCAFGLCPFVYPGGMGGTGGSGGSITNFGVAYGGGKGNNGTATGGFGAGSTSGGGGGGGGGKGYSGTKGQDGIAGKSGSKPSKSVFLLVNNYINGSFSVIPNNVTFDNFSYRAYACFIGGSAGQAGLGSNGHTSKINILARSLLSENESSEVVTLNNQFKVTYTYYGFDTTPGSPTYGQFIPNVTDTNIIHPYLYTKRTKIFTFRNNSTLNINYSDQTKGLDGVIGGVGFGGGGGGGGLGALQVGNPSVNGLNGGLGNAGGTGKTGVGGAALSNTPEKKVYSF